MPVEVHFTNLQDLSKLSKAMGEAGGDLKKELRKALRRAVQPLGVKARQGIPAYMPSGYAPVLKRSFRASTRIGLSANPSVRLVGQAKGKVKKRKVRDLDRGILSRPVNRARTKWLRQKIRAGFWTDPMRAGASEVREEIVTVVRDINRKLVRRVTGG